MGEKEHKEHMNCWERSEAEVKRSLAEAELVVLKLKKRLKEIREIGAGEIKTMILRVETKADILVEDIEGMLKERDETVKVREVRFEEKIPDVVRY